MKLSESEKRLVKRWENQERDWRWGRWVILSMCSILVVMFTLVFRWLVIAASEERAAGFIALWGPAVWIIIVVGSWRIVETLYHWRGDIKTRLLLRLIAEYGEKDT